jgi:hypothetical protein
MLYLTKMLALHDDPLQAIGIRSGGIACCTCIHRVELDQSPFFVFRRASQCVESIKGSPLFPMA